MIFSSEKLLIQLFFALSVSTHKVLTKAGFRDNIKNESHWGLAWEGRLHVNKLKGTDS